MVVDHGWELSDRHIYIDNDTSASKPRDGSQWGAMLGAIRRKEFDVVVGVDLDRLVRRIQDLATLIDLGVKVLTVEGDIDLTTADGELRATILTAMARFEVRRKSERQLRANDYRASLGKPKSGPRRFGYERDGMTANPSEAAVVKWIFEEFGKGRSINRLAIMLEQQGVDATPRSTWSRQRVRYILHNPIYAGAIVRKGVVQASSLVTPLISEEVSTRVRQILDDPSRRTVLGPVHRHLVSGLARCGTCGKKMCYKVGYSCVGDSTHPCIKEEFLDRRVRWEIIRAFRYGTAAEFSTQSGVDVDGYLASRAELSARVAEIDFREMNRLYSLSEARRRLAEVAAERELLEIRITDARAAFATASMLFSLEVRQMRTTKINWEDAPGLERQIGQRFDEMEFEQRRELIRGVLDITVHHGRRPDRVVVVHKIAQILN